MSDAALLRSEGQWDSHGVFTLDRRQAQDKMREFQLREPRLYVLHLVQAAGALGASSVEFEPHRGALCCRMVGVTLPADVMEEPLLGLLASAESPELAGYRHLSIGINAALALPATTVELASNGRIGCVTPHGTQLAEAETQDTVVTVRTRARFPLPWRRHDRFTAEALQQRAVFGSTPVRWSGERLLAPTPGLASYTRGRIRMWLGERPGRVAFVRYGVLICERTLQLKIPSANAMVRADDLLTNLSDTDVVENDAYNQVLSELDVACDGWLNTVCDVYSRSPQQEALRQPLLQALASQIMSPRLLGVPIFATVSGQPVSVRDLQQHAQTHARLLYWPNDRPPPDPWLGDGVVVLVRDRREQVALQTLFGRQLQSPFGWKPDPVPTSRAAYSRALALPPERYLVRLPLSDARLVGEFALRPPPSAVGTIAFFKKGRRLGERHFGDQPVGFRMTVNDDAFVLNTANNDIVEEDRYRTVLKLATRMVGEACARLTRGETERGVARTVLLNWLVSRHRDFDRVDPSILNHPLFATLAGHHVSMDDLMADADRFGVVSYAIGVARGYQGDDRHIVVDPPAVVLLPRLFQNVLDYSATLLLERSQVCGTPTVSALGPCRHGVTFHFGRGSGAIGLLDGAMSRVRRLTSGRPVDTLSLTLEYGAVEALIDMPGMEGDLVEAVREGCLALLRGMAAQKVLGTDSTARDFALRYLLYRAPDIPVDLQQVPLFFGLGGTPLSIGQLRRQPRLRYIRVDRSEWASETPIMVASAPDAALAAQLCGLQSVENAERDLYHQAARRTFEDGPPCSTAVDGIHQVDIDIGRLGFLPLTEAFDGHSRLRIVHRQRLLATVQVATPIALDLVCWDPDLVPLPGCVGVQVDAACQRAVKRLLDAIDIGIDTLHREGRADDVCMLWALAGGITLEDGTLRARIFDMPCLRDSEAQPMTLRDVARQAVARGRCLYVPDGTRGRPGDPTLRLVQLSPLRLQAFQAAFRTLETGALAAPAEPSAVGRRVPSLAWPGALRARLPVPGGGEIGISPDGQAGIQVVRDEVVISNHPYFGDLPVVGVVADEGALDGALDALYATVDDLGLLLPYFRYRHDRLASLPAARRPLLATNQGQRLSLEAVLNTPGTVQYSLLPPLSDTCMLVLDVPTRDFLQDVLGSRLQRGPRPVVGAVRGPTTPTVSTRAPWWSAWLLRWRRRLRHLLLRPVELSVEQAAPLLEALQAALAGGGLNLPATLVEDGDLLRIVDGRLALNRSHPCLAGLIEQPDGAWMLAPMAFAAARRAGLTGVAEETACLQRLAHELRSRS